MPGHYNIDVIERPVVADEANGIRANPAHSRVESDPAIENASRFKRLKEALALLAVWAIEPTIE